MKDLKVFHGPLQNFAAGNGWSKEQNTLSDSRRLLVLLATERVKLPEKDK